MALHRAVRPIISLIPLAELAPGVSGSMAALCMNGVPGPHWRWKSDDAAVGGSSKQPPGVDHTVDFGYQEVPVQEKAGLVGKVFSNVAPSYDVMNDLMSGGLHRLWKDRLVSTLAPWPGQRHLDVAGGTGDVAFRVLRAIRAAEARAAALPDQPGHVTVFDINAEMLQEGQRRAAKFGLASGEGLSWVQGDAEDLPFDDESMDSYTVAFGIRNVTRRDKALAEAYRVLRPGGRFLCLEFSQVVVPGLRQVYDAYSFAVIPKVGRLVAGDEESYQYLVESIRKFPDQDAWAQQVTDAGFAAVRYENLTAGVVAIHSGFKL